MENLRPYCWRIVCYDIRVLGELGNDLGALKKDRELLQRVFFDEEDKDLVCKQLGVARSYLRVLLYRAPGCG